MITVAQLIVVVETSPRMRQSLEQILQVSGYDTALFSSAEDMLADPGALEADCFVVDVNLPCMSGVALRKELSARGKLAPVIFLTDERVPAAFERHFQARFLQKPFRGYRLIRAIRTLLNVEE
ncbi:MAG: response regulator [Nibricoccus sp.]